MTQRAQADSYPVLVTGAGGFLGSEIVRQTELSGLRACPSDRHASLDIRGLEYRKADVLDSAELRHAMAGVGTVVHAAGLAHIFNPAEGASALFDQINVTGSANVARAAAEAGVHHLVLISSVSVYGRHDGLRSCDETVSCLPEGPYAQSKWRAEQRTADLLRHTDTRLTILRMATIYGEGDPGNVIRLIRAIDRGRFVWIGPGRNRKSLIHREDAARACVAAVRQPGSGVQTYNVSAPACTMSEVVEAIAGALGRRLPRWHVPAPVALSLSAIGSVLAARRGRLGALHGMVRKWLADDVYDASRFRQAYGFETQVDLAAGMRREVVWGRGREEESSDV